MQGYRGWTKPFVVYGVNPLVAFLGSGLMARIIDSLWKVKVGDKMVSVHQLTFSWLSFGYLSDRFASLLWALSFVTLWLAILWLLYRRNIIIRL